MRPRVRHAQEPAGNADTDGIQGLQGNHHPAGYIHHTLRHTGRTGGTAPQAGRHTRTDRLLRCAPLDATGAAVPMQRVQHGMPRFPPAAEKPGKGQPTAGDGKGAAPRRTDAAGTGQADVHRNGTSERLHGL